MSMAAKASAWKSRREGQASGRPPGPCLRGSWPGGKAAYGYAEKGQDDDKVIVG
jgi:hypothetical protein